MNCIDKDSTKCTVDNVFMAEGESGDFGANFDLPKNLEADTSELNTALWSKKYSGQVLIASGGDADSLDDYFDQIGGDDEEDLFPDGDDGKYIDEDDKPDNGFPWEIITPGFNRRNLKGKRRSLWPCRLRMTGSVQKVF